METVRLKNGTEEARPLVSVVMVGLRRLFDDNPIAFYELVMRCRDKSHKLFSVEIKDVLAYSCLMDVDGTIHDSIRNIVLSAVEGELLEMKLSSPIAEATP